MGLGGMWTESGLSSTWYNHVLTPNSPSCANGNGSIDAIATAGSFHHGGCHVVFADGHVQFVANDVDSGVWSEFGSRIQSDTVFD